MISDIDFESFNYSYKDLYILNNRALSGTDDSLKQIRDRIFEDVEFVLESLKISPSKFGYSYWRDAAYIFILSGKNHVSICNDIYPLVANKHGKSAMSVERAMRLCFENVLYYCSKADSNFVIEYFKNFLLHPHNSTILIKIVELISSSEFQKRKQTSLKS